jgi:hypothetical protein
MTTTTDTTKAVPADQVRGQGDPSASARAGKKVIAGHFDFEVSRQFKMLAVQQNTTVQLLLAKAINDFFEKNKLSRIADENPQPRGPAPGKK